MHVDAIENSLPDFKQVTIRKTGGFMGADETLHVDASGAATITRRHAKETQQAMQLDATQAQELMQALKVVAEKQPEASTAKGADFFNYDIELSWNGHTYRVHSVDVGADDALHGVMFAANRIMAGDDARADKPAMQLHDVSADFRELVGVNGETAANGNSGIVPPAVLNS